MTQILLVDFPIFKPDPGLFFWTTIIFVTLWFFLGRAAFRPIQNALKKRENDIQYSLDEARRARDEMSRLHSENEQLLIQAREERTKLLQDADRERHRIIDEAREKAREEARRVAVQAQQDIENQRKAAIIDLKNQVGTMAVDIAEKILKRELSDDQAQQQYVTKLVDEIKMN